MPRQVAQAAVVPRRQRALVHARDRHRATDEPIPKPVPWLPDRWARSIRPPRALSRAARSARADRATAYQEVCLKLIEDDFRRIRAYGGRGSFTGYILTVVDRILIDLVRRELPRRRCQRRSPGRRRSTMRFMPPWCGKGVRGTTPIAWPPPCAAGWNKIRRALISPSWSRTTYGYLEAGTRAAGHRGHLAGSLLGEGGALSITELCRRLRTICCCSRRNSVRGAGRRRQCGCGEASG